MTEISPANGVRAFPSTRGFVSALARARRGACTETHCDLRELRHFALNTQKIWAPNRGGGFRFARTAPEARAWTLSASLCVCARAHVCALVRVCACALQHWQCCLGDVTGTSRVQPTSCFSEADVSGKRRERPRDPRPAGVPMNVLHFGEYLDPKNNHSCVVLRCPPALTLF